jgi:ubiquitin C-terminal hydrolase
MRWDQTQASTLSNSDCLTGGTSKALYYVLLAVLIFITSVTSAARTCLMFQSDKSMVELELDLNQKFGEWVALQEAGSQLKPLYGPGYTGLVNLGNSCYMNSLMQVIFVIPDFIKR